MKPSPLKRYFTRGDDARGTGLPLLLLALRLALAADGGHEGDQLRRLAAVGRHHVQLELVLGRALGQEGEPGAVGRPPRLDVAPRPGGKAARLATGDIDDPDVRKIFVAL